MEYILSPKTERCVFCDKISADDDASEHVLIRGQTAYVTLNRYPYNNGHMLVVPYAHVPSLEDLSPQALQEMMLLANRCLAALRQAMNPDGFNLGINLGRLAGAGIEEHVHLHVVPRWHADTSFMTAIAHTRTLPETLDQTFERLAAALKALTGPEGSPRD
jgi:ATP adenylyltransferase